MTQKVNILLLGATGKTGRVIAKELKSNSNVKLTIFVRNPQKLHDMECSDINVVHGDVCISDMIFSENGLGENQSLGITN